jgi:hypothetical protein
MPQKYNRKIRGLLTNNPRLGPKRKTMLFGYILGPVSEFFAHDFGNRRYIQSAIKNLLQSLYPEMPSSFSGSFKAGSSQRFSHHGHYFSGGIL